jgi:hypothetical protein
MWMICTNDAGSSNVLHLHGELLKVRSTKTDYIWIGRTIWILVILTKTRINCARISFGLAKVPALDDHNTAESADYFAVIGTSLQVYPAAGLMISHLGNTYFLYWSKAYKIQISEIHWRLFLKWLQRRWNHEENLLHKCNEMAIAMKIACKCQWQKNQYREQ